MAIINRFRLDPVFEFERNVSITLLDRVNNKCATLFSAALVGAAGAAVGVLSAAFSLAFRVGLDRVEVALGGSGEEIGSLVPLLAFAGVFGGAIAGSEARGGRGLFMGAGVGIVAGIVAANVGVAAVGAGAGVLAVGAVAAAAGGAVAGAAAAVAAGPGPGAAAAARLRVEQRAMRAFVSAVLHNDLDSVPPQSRLALLEDYQRMTPNAVQRFVKVTIENLIRSPRDVAADNTPRFIQEILPEILALQESYRQLGRPDGFSLANAPLSEEDNPMNRLIQEGRNLAGRLWTPPQGNPPPDFAGYIWALREPERRDAWGQVSDCAQHLYTRR